MDVFLSGDESKAPFRDLALDLLEPSRKPGRLTERQQSRPLEREAMGQAPCDVMEIEPAIDLDRRDEGLDIRISRAAKPSGPGLSDRGFACHQLFLWRHARPMPLVRFRDARMASRSPFRRINPSASFCR